MSLNIGILSSSYQIPSGSSLLLDTYSGATAAYSLRKLRTAYSGSAIRVRRSSDNTETDIGFIAGVLDTTTLLTFCGVGNGFVTTWYDQSGNSYNATQSNSTYQPKIVNAGVVYLFGTKPSLYFSSSNIGVPETSFSKSQPNTYFTVVQGTTTNNTGYRTIQEGFFGTNPYRNSVGKSDTNVYYLYAGSLITSSTTYTTIKSIISSIFNTTSSYMYLNNSAIISNQNVGSQPLSGLLIGGFSNTVNLFEGYIPEYIFYNSNKSTSLSGINANINSFYTIY